MKDNLLQNGCYIKMVGVAFQQWTAVAIRSVACGRGFRIEKMIYIVCVAAAVGGAGGTAGRFLKQIQSTADMGEYYY